MSSSVDELATSLGLHRSGHEWRGDCPACNYRNSLVLGIGRSGAPLLWCANCRDRDGLRALLSGHGAAFVAPRNASEIERRREQRERRKERALALWSGSEPTARTLADDYLTAR